MRLIKTKEKTDGNKYKLSIEIELRDIESIISKIAENAKSIVNEELSSCSEYIGVRYECGYSGYIISTECLELSLLVKSRNRLLIEVSVDSFRAFMHGKNVEQYARAVRNAVTRILNMLEEYEKFRERLMESLAHEFLTITAPFKLQS